ncbi:MAG: polyphosphate kinase 1 [Deltaproteobacteria bacterium]|nr:MAG: polyphosphate kinase 1 [Deltaproteobacteria bacterium]
MSARPAQADLSAPDLYINRELSLLEFNRRVLAQAGEEEAPLLERLRFLTIASTNLDEFFEIRVAGLKQQQALGLSQTGPDGLDASTQLQRISELAHRLVAEQYRILNEQLLPALEREGIRFLRRKKWSTEVRQWTRRYFLREVLPVLTPIGLDPAHPFPKILNKSLNFIVGLEGKDAFGRSSRMAVVQAPRSLPRLIEVPRQVAGGPAEYNFVLLTSVIQTFVDDLFPGMKTTGCYQFRVTRNSDLWVDEEEVDDLLHALAGELPRRNYGDAVRLEVGRDCPEEITHFLLEQFDLDESDLYQVDGPVNLHRLAALYELVQRPDLKYPPYVPVVPAAVQRQPDIFAAIRAGDILLHHPFEAFSPVMELLHQAASDPACLAVKMTLYRTGVDSPVVDALIAAARAGKEVTAVVELRARFDEAANIDLAGRLQDAGANVVYGVVGYKTHAKMLMVVRREGRRMRRYVHLGTGNYHTRTTRLYTDLGLLTCDKEIGEDVHRVFMQLTGLGKVRRLKKLLQSPFTLHDALLKQIAREAEHAKKGKKARIIAKMNSLSEPQVIRALYEASRAGVEIDLIVRGICCLRPGIPGVSERIRVRSIVDRFLEHTRVFYFYNGGKETLYASSADWMVRNLFRRVEVAFPLEARALAQRAFKECLQVYLEDNQSAWILRADGTYQRARPGNAKPRRAQWKLMEMHASEQHTSAG